MDFNKIAHIFKNTRPSIIVLAIIVSLIAVAAFLALLAFPFMWLWNATMPYITVEPLFAKIDYTLAFWLVAFKVLFFTASLSGNKSK